MSDGEQELGSSIPLDKFGYRWMVYPPPTPPILAENDLVYQRTQQERAVVEEVVTEGKFKGRVRVRYLSDGSTYHSRPERLIKIPSCQQKMVMVTEDTKTFRLLGTALPSKQDFVVELGASTGMCTEILQRKAGRVVAVETSELMLEEARALCPEVQFECFDCMIELPRLFDLGRGADGVWLDIGGDRQVNHLLELIPHLQEEIGPPLIVVKSKRLAPMLLRKGCVRENGLVEGVRTWWDRNNEDENAPCASIATVQGRDLMHPLRYPQVLAPDGTGTEICRFHNYLSCLKECCRRNHTNCHVCLEEGHRAIECSAFR
ncbi:unnamed protein product [Chrysoparadoxa australica]